jgi:membrane protein
MVSFAMVLGLGFILLVSLIVDALASSLGQEISNRLGTIGATGLSTISNLVSIALSIAIFSLIFKFLPDARVRWREVLWGSLFTAVLFSLGRMGIGYYIGNSTITSGFGAAGSLVALLVWTYYSSQIVFLGAEFIWLLAKRRGFPVLPGKRAVRVITRTKRIESDRKEQEGLPEKDDKQTAMPEPPAVTAGGEFVHQSKSRRVDSQKD